MNTTTYLARLLTSCSVLCIAAAAMCPGFANPNSQRGSGGDQQLPSHECHQICVRPPHGCGRDVKQ